MKQFKIKALVAAAMLAGVACGASAQSSVNISGVMDMAVVGTQGAGTKLDQVGNGGNELAFFGSEDLGGGLKANFRFVERFSPESGGHDGSANGRPLFQGESTVGLSGGFGSFKVGRSVTALQETLAVTSVNGLITQGSTANLATGYTTDAAQADKAGGTRTDAITYKSPVWNGVSAAVSYGFADSASSGAVVTGANDLLSAWVKLDKGAIMLGGGTEKNRTGDTVTAVLGTYDLGVAKFGLGYSLVDTAAVGGDDGVNWNAMVSVPYGKYTMKAGYYESKAEGTGLESRKTALAADYSLSKRTTLYTSYGVTHKASTGNVAGYDFGIRHAF